MNMGERPPLRHQTPWGLEDILDEAKDREFERRFKAIVAGEGDPKYQGRIRCQTCKGKRVEWVEIGHGEWDERPCSDCQGES